MAQSKTRSSRASNSRGRSASTRTGSNGARAKGSSSRSRSGGSSKRGSSQANAGGSSRGGAQANDGSTVASVAEKAKGPAIIGGAALVGLAGGFALSHDRKPLDRARAAMPSLALPKPTRRLRPPKSSTIKVLGGAAKEIAKGSYRVGQLASEVRRVREAIEVDKD